MYKQIFIILGIFFLVIILLLTLFITNLQAEAPENVPMTIQEYAEMRVLQEFGDGQWESFDRIVHKESGWISTAQNPYSTAFGLMQFLDSTWKSVGCTKTTIPELQIECGINYIKKRYGVPDIALKYHIINNWY